MRTRKLTHQAVRRKRRHAFIVALVLFLLAALGVSHTVKWFRNNLQATEKAVFDTYAWDGRGQINLLIIGNPYILMVLRPESGYLKLLTIPEDTRLTVAGGFGEYRIRAIYELGELEGKRQGAAFVTSSVSRYFGVPIDGYVLHHDFMREQVIEYLRAKGKDPLWWVREGPVWFLRLESNLSRYDLGRVVWALTWARFDKVRAIELRPGSELMVLTRKDDTIELIPNELAVDRVVQAHLQDETVVRERQRVVIKNATLHPGLGAQVARRLRNLGADVVAVENAQMFSAQTKVYGLPSYTLKRVHQLVVSSYNTTQSSSADPRADITVEVGEDEWLHR